MKSAIVAIVAALAASACEKSSPHPTTPASAGTAAPAAGSAAAGGSGQAAYFTVPADQLPHLKIVPARQATWSTTVRTIEGKTKVPNCSLVSA